MVVARRAASDIDAAELWLVRRGAPAAAAKLGRLLVEKIDTLSEHAERGHPILGGRREINVRFGRSRYIVTYRVADGAVIITRIQHHLTRRRLPPKPLPRRREPR